MGEAKRRSSFSAKTTTVLIKGHIADIMQFIFNTPMSSAEIEQALRGCFVRRKTGYPKSNITAKFVAFKISCYALNSHNLLVIREITISLQHCAAVDATDLYVSVPFVCGYMLRILQISLYACQLQRLQSIIPQIYIN